MYTKSIQVSTSQWWEISYPMSGVFELLNFLYWNVHHSQQIVLELYWYCSFWELGWVSVCFQLACQLLGCCADGHSCTMVAEWEQNVVAVQSFIPSIEVAFGHGEGMTQVQQTIHVCVWEGLEEFGFLVGLDSEILIPFPNVSGSLFQTDQFVSSDGTGLFLLFHD